MQSPWCSEPPLTLWKNISLRVQGAGSSIAISQPKHGATLQNSDPALPPPCAHLPSWVTHNMGIYLPSEHAHIDQSCLVETGHTENFALCVCVRGWICFLLVIFCSLKCLKTLFQTHSDWQKGRWQGQQDKAALDSLISNHHQPLGVREVKQCSLCSFPLGK